MADMLPAVILKHRDIAEALLLASRAFEVASDLDAEKAAGFVSKSREFDAKYRADNAPLLEQADLVRETLRLRDKAREAMRGHIGAYRLRQEEESRLREQEALAKATQIAQDKALDSASTLEALGDSEGSEAILDRAIHTTPLIPVGQGVHTPAKTHFRKQWYFDPGDFKALQDEFKTWDMEKLNKLVKAMEAQTNTIIPEAAGVARFKMVPVVKS